MGSCTELLDTAVTEATVVFRFFIRIIVGNQDCLLNLVLSWETLVVEKPEILPLLHQKDLLAIVRVHHNGEISSILPSEHVPKQLKDILYFPMKEQLLPDGKLCKPLYVRILNKPPPIFPIRFVIQFLQFSSYASQNSAKRSCSLLIRESLLYVKA